MSPNCPKGETEDEQAAWPQNGPHTYRIQWAEQEEA